MEIFKPVAIRPPSENRALFWLRCVGDLQLLTIFRFLRPRLATWRGRVLDVGAGESPWRELMPDAEYTGIDTAAAAAFGMSAREDIAYYDGGTLPFADETFDHVLCTEVLEHVPAPARFLADLHRVLRTGGTLALTVPWSARVHHAPHDYHRFTRYALAEALGNANFSDIAIHERGNDITAIANKLLIRCLALLRPASPLLLLCTWPLALILLPFVGASLIAAHVSLAMEMGAKDDPLGYGVAAVKAEPAVR